MEAVVEVSWLFRRELEGNLVGFADIKDSVLVPKTIVEEELLIFKDCVKVAPGDDAVLQTVEGRVKFLLWQQGLATEEIPIMEIRTVDWYRL